MNLRRTCGWIAAVAVLPISAASGGSTRPPVAVIRRHIDPEWFRRSLVENSTTHWLAATPSPNGFFRITLDRRWQPYDKQVATLTTQSRQLFVLGTGWRMTGDEAYRNAVRKGAGFMLEHFRDREHGGWYAMAAPDGTVLDTSKNAYGHAFVIFGMSHAFLFTRDERFRKAALDAWAEMKARMRDEQGFIRPQATREFGAMPDAAPEHPLYLEFRAATPPAGPYPPSTVNNQNPMMHLFEALLALHDATGSRDVLRDAEDLAGRIFTRLFQEREGYLPEMYDADWQPLPQDKRGYIELGHQFEWAYLLSRGAEHGLAPRFLEIGRRLLDYGMNHAYDAANGGIFSRANYAGEVSSGGKGAWEQCEALRAMMHYAALRGRADLWPAFDKSLAFVKQFFLDDECGGWYTSYNPRSPRTERQSFKGSLGKAGYHDTGMYVEGLRLAGTLPALKR